MDLDRTDIEILRALQDDARRSYRDVARKIGVSVPTVSARVANLEQLGILKGYHASVDVERLGQVPLVLIVRCRPGAVDSVGETLASMPQVRWTVRTQGSRIVAEAVLLPSDSVGEFLGRIRRLRGVIDLERHLAAKRFKDAPRAIIAEGLQARLDCFECGKAIESEMVKRKLDGRNHYFCCSSCEAPYVQRYLRIREGVKTHGKSVRPRPVFARS